MMPPCVERMKGHVDCGLFRLNVTANGPSVVTLFRFPSSGDGEFAPASFTTLAFTTRSKDHLTSADVKSSPFWNLTPWRSVHRQVAAVSTGLQLVASDGATVAFCLGSYRCSKMFWSS